MKQHVNRVISRLLRHSSVQSSTTQAVKRHIASYSIRPGFIPSILDYCNPMLTSLLRTSISTLQGVHNAAARLLGLSPSGHIILSSTCRSNNLNTVHTSPSRGLLQTSDTPRRQSVYSRLVNYVPPTLRTMLWRVAGREHIQSLDPLEFSYRIAGTD